MKLKKSITAFVLGLSLMSNMAYAQNISFKDINDSYWAKKSIEKITNAGIIQGYPDGTFKPDAPVTRAEFIRIVNGVMGYKDTVSESSFKDVKKDGWYYSSLLIAEKYGYISGFEDGTFRPNEKITKEQVCVIVSKITDIKQLPNAPIPKDEISAWSKPYVNTVLSNRLMALDGKGNFYPRQYATRAIVADVLSNFVMESENKQDKKEEPKKTLPSSGGGGGKITSPTDGNKGNNTNTETEQEKTIRQSKKVAEVLKAKINSFEKESQKEIIRDIVTNMEAYAKDPSYDYKSSVEIVRKKYNNLSDKEKEDLKKKIAEYANTQDLIDLKDKLL